jgi:hypothetical protein
VLFHARRPAKPAGYDGRGNGWRAVSVARTHVPALGHLQRWKQRYELEINMVVRETLTDPLELTVDRLAWALHGLGIVAGASVYYASLANQEDPHEVELAVQRVIEAFEPGSAPSTD